MYSNDEPQSSPEVFNITKILEENQTLTVEIEDAKNMLEAYETEIQNYKMTIDNHELEIEKHKITISNYESEIEKLKTTISNFELEIEKHKTQYNELKISFDRKCDEIRLEEEQKYLNHKDAFEKEYAKAKNDFITQKDFIKKEYGTNIDKLNQIIKSKDQIIESIKQQYEQLMYVANSYKEDAAKWYNAAYRKKLHNKKNE